MRILLLIIAIVVGCICGHGYGIVLWVLCRIVLGLIVQGAESSGRYHTYESQKSQSSNQKSYQHTYQRTYQRTYQQNNTNHNSPKTEYNSMEYYYKVLGVPSAATDAEVKKAYRDMVRKYHPDMVSTQGESVQRMAERKTQEINEAYQNIKSWRNMN